jgi:YHS domain-containing protein
MTKDPVCKTLIETRTAQKRGLAVDFDGQTFWFCSADCKKEFERDPQKYSLPVRWPEDFEVPEAEQAL